MSAISSADSPGALVRISRRHASRALPECPTLSVELRHQLAVSQECSQPLLRRHALDVFAQVAARSIGQFRSHEVM
jgi:hypothetical protein